MVLTGRQKKLGSMSTLGQYFCPSIGQLPQFMMLHNPIFFCGACIAVLHFINIKNRNCMIFKKLQNSEQILLRHVVVVVGKGGRLSILNGKD